MLRTVSPSDALSSLSMVGLDARREGRAVEEVLVEEMSVVRDREAGRVYAPAAMEVTSAGMCIVRTSTPSTL